MAKVRNVALGVVVAILVALAVLFATGSLGAVYRWLVRYMQPGVWSALGTWSTALVACL